MSKLKFEVHSEIVHLIKIRTVSEAYAQQLYNENSPPILTLDRSWDLLVSEPVGTVITRVKAFDQENDVLTFGLEMIDSNRENPFIIDPDTGVVKLNKSLEKRAGEKFLMYVTVNDGQLTMKTEVFVNIKTKVGSKGPQLNKSSRPPYYPTYLLPSPPVVKSEVVPPPKYTPALQESPKRKTEVDTTTDKSNDDKKDTTHHTLVTNPKINATEDSTSSPSNKIAYTIIPTTAICGILLFAALIIYLFRRRLCKYRNKLQKDDMRKESLGGIVTEDPIAMHHWRGPRAFSNRYEGWDPDRNPMPPPIQNTRESISKSGDKWEFPRHHLKVFNILGEGCFGQVWRCEALNIDGKYQQRSQ
ncbi:hypothetical protein RUM44_004358 [Polyplax serrata]|uniref:Cadherin domain-containing protein n=1 Tax=Polyplax serrata TaxID=468196 RepID=A0ABR1B3A3_POLSC